MIKLTDKIDCCGCSACVESCPKHCIKMQADNEGFLYPIINKAVCINCHLCEKVCPMSKQTEQRIPQRIYAAKSKDETIRSVSSSGGVFYIIAKKVIQKGGVVFGASFDKNWNVHHKSVTTCDDLDSLMRSQYVQSNIENSYNDVLKNLKENKLVLFVGTPCQVAGLHAFCQREYENLITIDFLCHGVPSPKVWSYYLHKIKSCKKDGNVKITGVDFRNKTYGWRNYSLNVSFSDNTEYKTIQKADWYMIGFLNNLYLRPCCHSCHFKRFQSKSDLTIADFWGVYKSHASFDDDTGISIVFVNTERGCKIFQLSDFDTINLNFSETLSNNGLNEHVPKHSKREKFFEHLDEYKDDVIPLIKKCITPPFYRRAYKYICKKLK